MKVILALVFVVLFTSLFIMDRNSYAYFLSGNITFGYSSHSCYKPSKPMKPFSLTSQWEVDSYNQKVKTYNSDVEIYIDCIEDYLDKAKNDIENIKYKMKEAVDDAESLKYDW